MGHLVTDFSGINKIMLNRSIAPIRHFWDAACPLLVYALLLSGAPVCTFFYCRAVFSWSASLGIGIEAGAFIMAALSIWVIPKIHVN